MVQQLTILIIRKYFQFINLIFIIKITVLFASMSDPATITNILQQTLIGSTQSISQAQKCLKSFHNNPNFLHNLLLIAQQSTIPYNIQKAAVIYTLRIARDYIDKEDIEKMQLMAKFLVNFMIQQQIEITLMKHLSSTIQLILLSDHKFQIRNEFQLNYVQMLNIAAQEQDCNIKFQFLGLCAQMILGSTRHATKELNQFIKISIPNFTNLSIRVMLHVKSATDNGQREAIMRSFRILKVYSYAFKLYLRKIIYSSLQTVKQLYEENLCRLLMMSFQLSVGNNQLSNEIIFYQRNQDNDMIELLHSIKADYITSFSYMARAILQNFKDSKMVLSHSLLQQENLFPTIIHTVSQLFSKCPYHKIKSSSTIKLLQQLLNLLIIAVRSNVFYNILLKEKQTILHGCIFKTLYLSPSDYQNYFLEPEQFLNEILQIVEMDPQQYLKSRKKQTGLDSEGYEEVQSYSTLRTVSSTLMSSYCKSIDGTLPEIFQFAFKVFQNDSAQSEVPKTLLLCLMGVLRDQAANRQNFIEEVVMLLMKVIYSREFPKFNNAGNQLQELTKDEQEKSIEYTMMLVVLYKYLPKVSGIQEQILPTLYQIVEKILLEPKCSDALKYISYDLAGVLMLIDDQAVELKQGPNSQKIGQKLLRLLNHQLDVEYRNAQKILQTIFQLFKYKDHQIYESPQLLIATINNLAQIIYKQVSLNQESITKLNINKSWNIITNITENQIFIPQFINEIENAIMPLLQFIDGKRELDYEENIFMMMSSFIRKSKQVTQNELVMFEIIPKLFYTQYNHILCHAFETLQVFIMYGSNILATAPQAMNLIIQMSVASMNTVQFKISEKQTKYHNQSDNCEGVLTLHSLILSCGSSFTPEIWMGIAKAFNHRMQNPPVKTNILMSNLVAGLALVVMIGHNCFTQDDSNILLNTVLQNYTACTLEYPCKTLVICLSQLLSQVTLPFIANRFTYILDSIVCLLQVHNNSKQVFSRKPLTQQERDYKTLITMINNRISQIDQIEYFKKKIKEIKQKFPQVLQQSYNQLSDQNKDYLKSLMSLTTVVGDKRKIFKITKSNN